MGIIGKHVFNVLSYEMEAWDKNGEGMYGLMESNGREKDDKINGLF